jgi:hypothetical protein
MNRIAILNGHEVVPCIDIHIWEKWFTTTDTHVANDMVSNVRISTVFLGVDHGWDNRKLWFETMVFGGALDGKINRYTTWNEAVAGHKAMVEEVKQLT